MLSKKLFSALLVLAVAGRVTAADVSPVDALRTKFPKGIPWRVAFADANGKSRGELEMVITSNPAHSCMGEIGDGFRVEFIHPGALSSSVPIAFYGVATFVGRKVEIDLTGGTCDAYFFMDGMLTPDGSSSGNITTFGRGGRHVVGTYRANVQ